MRTAPSRTQLAALALAAAVGGGFAALLALGPSPTADEPASAPSRAARTAVSRSTSETSPEGEAPAASTPARDERRSAPGSRPVSPSAATVPAGDPAEAEAELPEDLRGPFDTAHPPADPCEAVAQDEERLDLTQRFIDRLPEKNRELVGAKVLYDLRERTEKAYARHLAAVEAAGLKCGEDDE